MAGFYASLSAEDIKNRSERSTGNVNNNFPLTVPAGEGRIVEQKTTLKSITTLYEAALRPERTVGIVVNPGIFKPNQHLFFYNIEAPGLFPDAISTSRISRTTTTTVIQTKIFKMPKQEGEKPTEIVEFHSFNSDNALVGLEDIGIAVSESPAHTVEGSPPGPSPLVATMNIKVQFAGLKPEVPLEKRQGGTERFRALIVMNVHPIGNPSTINYEANFASGRFSIPYDPKQITNAELGAAVINQAQVVPWGGKFSIYFS